MKASALAPKKARTYVLLQSPVGGYMEMLEEHKIEPLLRTGWRRIPPQSLTLR